MFQFRALQTRTSRAQRRTFFGLFAVSVLALMAWAFGAATGSASARTTQGATAKVTTITVTAGKPSEFAFKLSKTSSIPAGKVAFKVTNKGLIGHSFKLCTKPVASAKANSCVGKTTKVLKKGQSQTLTLTLKKGKFEFLCTVSGHAKNGMKGLLGVGTGVVVSQAKPNPAPTTPIAGSSPTATPTPTPAAAAGGCASPQTTNVTVNMVDFAFQGMPGTIPCGTVVIREVNAGMEDHNISFAGTGVTGGVGPVIPSGASATFTLTVTPGTYTYQCDVGDHAANGMIGAVRVT